MDVHSPAARCKILCRCLMTYKYWPVPNHEGSPSLLPTSSQVLFTFPVRARGHSADTQGRSVPQTWPSYDSRTSGLTQFASGGMTPTGLVAVDPNSPESSPTVYGPYPITRFVAGLAGNAAVLLPHLRNGILIHTGEVPCLLIDPSRT